MQKYHIFLLKKLDNVFFYVFSLINLCLQGNLPLKQISYTTLSTILKHNLPVRKLQTGKCNFNDLIFLIIFSVN